MQVEQAWKSLTARQRVDIVLSKDPDAKVSVKHPPEEPPQFWSAAAARALLLEAEMPQMGGGLEEAAGRMRLASDFAKLGLFQKAADSSLEAAIIFEKKERIKGTAAHVYDKVSAYAESSGNVAQAADAMRESERVRIALEIEKALQADGTLGKMKIELPELKSRLAEIVAREAVEEPALLARLVEYPEGSDGKAQVPSLKEGWRAHVGAMLKDGMASLLDRDSVSLLSSRGGFASDRLAIDRLVRFAQADEQMRKALGNLADPELKSLCTELYLRYKSMSEIEKEAGEFAHKFRKGYVENVARTALWYVKEEVERRLSAMNEKGVEAVKGQAKKPGEAVTRGKFRGVKGK